MKRFLYIFIIIILILALGFSFASCSYRNNDNNTEEEDNKDEKNNNGDKEKENPYLEIINSILEGIGSIENIGDYLASMILLLENIPLENIVQTVESLIGEEYEEYKKLVEEYYEYGMETLEFVYTLLPHIDTILYFIEMVSSNPTVAQYILPTLGITKDGNTYSFTYEGKPYSVEITETSYVITDENYVYYIEYNQEDSYFNCNMFDLIEEEEIITLESILINNNFYIQLLDSENQRLIQIKTNIQMLEAIVSIQKDDYNYISIFGGVSPNFATFGEVFVINEGMLSEYIQ